MTTIRVGLADDHPVVLAGVKALIQAAPEMELCGEAADGAAALAMIEGNSPDVAVLDLSLPGMSGLEVATRARAAHPQVKILVLTVHEDRAYLQKLLDVGVRGYLLKRSAAEELVRAIRAVFAGGLYIDPAIASKLLGDSGGGRAAARTDDLSGREEDVLKQASQGFSNKEIAAHLDLSIKTVETYKARAAEKLNLRSRADIVRYGVERGWLNKL